MLYIRLFSGIFMLWLSVSVACAQELNQDKLRAEVKRLTNTSAGKADLNQIKKYRESLLKRGISNLKSDSAIREHYVTLIALDSAYYTIAPDSLTRSQMAHHYNSLAWYCIITKKLTGVKYLLDQSLKFEPGYIYPKSNLPLLLLLQGRYGAAKELYLRYKDLPFDETHATYKEEFLEDFGELKKAGIVNQDVKKITRLLNEKN